MWVTFGAGILRWRWDGSQYTAEGNLDTGAAHPRGPRVSVDAEGNAWFSGRDGFAVHLEETDQWVSVPAPEALRAPGSSFESPFISADGSHLVGRGPGGLVERVGGKGRFHENLL